MVEVGLGEFESNFVGRELLVGVAEVLALLSHFLLVEGIEVDLLEEFAVLGGALSTSDDVGG